MASYSKSKNLEPKKSYEEKRKLEREYKKEVIDSIQIHSDEICDIALYGGDSSLRSHNRQRDMEQLENLKEAHDRTEREDEKVRDFKKMKKDHVGDFSSYHFDPRSIFLGQFIQA